MNNKDKSNMNNIDSRQTLNAKHAQREIDIFSPDGTLAFTAMNRKEAAHWIHANVASISGLESFIKTRFSKSGEAIIIGWKVVRTDRLAKNRNRFSEAYRKNHPSRKRRLYVPGFRDHPLNPDRFYTGL